MRHRGGRAQELAVPSKGPLETGLERELRMPVKNAAGALGTQKLMTNFVARLVEHFGTKRGLHLPEDQFDHVEHTDLDFIRKIKRLAANGSIRGEPLASRMYAAAASST